MIPVHRGSIARRWSCKINCCTPVTVCYLMCMSNADNTRRNYLNNRPVEMSQSADALNLIRRIQILHGAGNTYVASRVASAGLRTYHSSALRQVWAALHSLAYNRARYPKDSMRNVDAGLYHFGRENGLTYDELSAIAA